MFTCFVWKMRYSCWRKMELNKTINVDSFLQYFFCFCCNFFLFWNNFMLTIWLVEHSTPLLLMKIYYVCDLFTYFHVHYFDNCFLLTQKLHNFIHAHRYIQIKRVFDDIISYIVSNSKHWFTFLMVQLFEFRQKPILFW